jgi:hypothetical protein
MPVFETPERHSVETRRPGDPELSTRRKSVLGSKWNHSSDDFLNTRPLDIVVPTPEIPVEQRYNNFEEWMKMATDNVGIFFISLISLYVNLSDTEIFLLEN